MSRSPSTRILSTLPTSYTSALKGSACVVTFGLTNFFFFFFFFKTRFILRLANLGPNVSFWNSQLRPPKLILCYKERPIVHVRRPTLLDRKTRWLGRAARDVVTMIIFRAHT
jgi:hypothetical protein